MRRVWFGQLVLVAVLGTVITMTRFAHAADLPYEGTWKIVYLNGAQEVDLWLVKIDNTGKKAELLSTLPDPFVKDNKLTEFKASANAIELNFKGMRNNESFVRVYPGAGKGKPEALLGSVRINSNVTPVRFEKSEATEIDPRTAVRRAGGYADLEAAVKTPNADDKIKDLEEILKLHEGKPIVFVATQLLIGELVKKKAAAEAFKLVEEQYIKSATLYGPEMQIQAHANLCRGLLQHDKTAALALKHAEAAVKLFPPDANRGVKLNVYLTLANAQHTNGKTDDVKVTLAKITPIIDDVIARPRFAVGPLLPTQQMAAMLLGSPAPAIADAGLDYARKAVKLLKDDTPVGEKLATYTLLHDGLVAHEKRDGSKAGEARTVAALVDKLEEQFDKEYLKTALPYKPEKFAGRKGKSDRVTVVEIFTGAQCPPCVAADLAFDGLVETFQPQEVVLLQYHLHIPGPDPLTNPDTEARSTFYGDEVEGTPTLFVNGKATAPMGGARVNAKDRYDSLRELIGPSLETAPEAKINLKVSRNGEKIDVAADVADLKQTGEKVKLHFLLVEEGVRYQGNNGLPLHHHVVRAKLGENAGFKLEAKSSSHKASVDLDDLRKKLNSYLTTYSMKTQFPFLNRPLSLRRLKVVALIQDDGSKKILQAAQAHVPAAKE